VTQKLQDYTSMTIRKEVLRFLQKNGVETRFVSVIGERIYINNLKLSRFSRQRENIFLEQFPSFEVKRSKVFQRICTRASRVLKDALTPRERILLPSTLTCPGLTLYTVLEPYTRKYGVELILNNDLDEWDEKKLKNTGHIQDIDFHLLDKYNTVDAVALPLTLDGETEHILQTMLNGEKLELLSSPTTKNGIKLIYPLKNVPRSWLTEWVEIEGLNCVQEDAKGLTVDMLEFLEGFIPDVREKMMRSTSYILNDD
jgi:hypothetical protein